MNQLTNLNFFSSQEMSSFNVNSVRSHFPILNRSNRGKSIAYLDNAATSQKPNSVIDCLSNYYRNTNSNVHRGIYELAEEAEAQYASARKIVANHCSVRENEIIFTRGTTEALNLLAHSFGRAQLNSGDVIALTEMEHHANIVPWQIIGKELGTRIEVIPILPDGSLDRDFLSNVLKQKKVRILSLCAISNTLGTINPLKEIIREAHQNETFVVVDGAQSAPHERLNLTELDCDFFCFSGHKVYGPMGIGVLYGKAELLEAMPPYQGGGDMIDQVSFSGTTFASSPQKFEAGTPNVADAIALGEALRFFAQYDLKEVQCHETALLESARHGLSDIPGFKEHGTVPGKAAVLSFSIDGAHPHDLASILDAEGIAIRTGHHCCQPLMGKLGVEATARASFAFYNTLEETERLVKATHKAVTLLR
ncbi:MAG: SufS family cysteine desulfurase [Verrucomicrobiota bacterium]|nr:SufS family cysteine desulfurase [Verrucomicrobiota bacterium]